MIAGPVRIRALPQHHYPISERTEQLLLNALVWLAGELPAWEPLRMVIERFTADALGDCLESW